ncbi:MAG TPA: hypothetical protein VD978_24875 [Azospirillum sp.]|nr:hypothetical protein [Azospirillum sp.]
MTMLVGRVEPQAKPDAPRTPGTSGFASLNPTYAMPDRRAP